MRGARTGCQVGRLARGIIPADAGSTMVWRGGYWTRRDHPRGCGEHLYTDNVTISTRGSSPRMRGARTIVDIHRDECRIIPADAGSTSTSRVPKASTKDHPRGCGEHPVENALISVGIGSSPRMRGAPGRPGPARRGMGIIPADAGSTPPPALAPNGTGDHPRGCGEHSEASSTTAALPGSSPRMRGALVKVFAGMPAPRIIPADAGSTVLLPAALGLALDHPRGCGEHVHFAQCRHAVLGSSPRMRGALFPYRRRPKPLRIIPADAGSTIRHTAPTTRRRDHPRGCGEHSSVRSPRSLRGGSSPRMRGAPGSGWSGW